MLRRPWSPRAGLCGDGGQHRPRSGADLPPVRQPGAGPRPRLARAVGAQLGFIAALNDDDVESAAEAAIRQLIGWTHPPRRGDGPPALPQARSGRTVAERAGIGARRPERRRRRRDAAYAGAASAEPTAARSMSPASPSSMSPTPPSAVTSSMAMPRPAPSRTSSSRRPPACSAPTSPPAPAEGVRTAVRSRWRRSRVRPWTAAARAAPAPRRVAHRRSRSAPRGPGRRRRPRRAPARRRRRRGPAPRRGGRSAARHRPRPCARDPGPVVVDRDAHLPVGGRDGGHHAFGGMAAGVAHEVIDGATQGPLVAEHLVVGERRVDADGDGDPPRPGGHVAHHVGERDDAAIDGRLLVGAGQQEQVVDQALQPVELVEQHDAPSPASRLLRPLGDLELGAHHGDGRAQLVRRIGHQAPAARRRGLQPSQHPVHRAGQLGDLVGGPAARHALVSERELDRRHPGGDGVHRPQGATRQQPGQRRRRARRGPADDPEQLRVVASVSRTSSSGDAVASTTPPIGNVVTVNRSAGSRRCRAAGHCAPTPWRRHPPDVGVDPRLGQLRRRPGL